jgi:hypothetical protein
VWPVQGHQAPRQQFVDAVDGMIDDPFEDSTQIRKWLYIVQACRSDQAIDYRSALAAAVGPCEQISPASKNQFPIILPISGKKLKSIIVGIRCFVVASRHCQDHGRCRLRHTDLGSSSCAGWFFMSDEGLVEAGFSNFENMEPSQAGR